MTDNELYSQGRENGTAMTNQASELFELCRDVYERTGWYEVDKFWHSLVSHDTKRWSEYKLQDYRPSDLFGMRIVPLYTSDYLLEKLPRYIYLQQSADGKWWWASQLQPTELRTAENAYQSINTSAGTPLRALLLLTLKLHEEGLL